MLILDLWGISFHAVVVFGLGKNLLFRSVLGLCALVLILIVWFFYFQSTNMKSLTPDKALSGECGFMAANLYAKSIFGEDALANVSLEKNPAKPDATVTGHIRIRAKSQGKYTVDNI